MKLEPNTSRNQHLLEPIKPPIHLPCILSASWRDLHIYICKGKCHTLGFVGTCTCSICNPNVIDISKTIQEVTNDYKEQRLARYPLGTYSLEIFESYRFDWKKSSQKILDILINEF